MTTTTTQAVDTSATDAVEVVELSKSAKSDIIYAEELAKGTDGLRARCLTRFETELGLKKAGGGSTYFQNCKTRAAGLKVNHHYKPVSKRTEQAKNDEVNDSKEEADLFSVNLKDGTEQSFLSQQALDEFVAANADKIAE